MGARAAARGLWAMAWLVSSVLSAVLTAVLSGCVATPPVAEPPTPPPPSFEATARPQACPSCDDQTREVAHLRQDLAARESELRDLRGNQRAQVKVLQESTREVARAKVKLRRLATQADAASYIAEVEVAMASQSAAPTAPLMALAQDILESTAAPFAQGDYGMAMDRAAQAEQLIALVAYYRKRPDSRPMIPGEYPLLVAIPLKVTVDSPLHRQPRGTAPVVATLKKDSVLVAHAYKGNWMQVETEDGRWGWVGQMRLGAR
jgi:hypothetical protein